MEIRQLLLAPLALAIAAAAPGNFSHEREVRELNSFATAQEAQPGLVVIAGESWIFTIEDGQPANARKVDAKAKPAPGELMVTLDVSLGGAMMSVVNNGADWWDYRAFITTKPGHKGNRTSTCTLMGGGRAALEQWPVPVPAVRLADFTQAIEGQLKCR